MKKIVLTIIFIIFFINWYSCINARELPWESAIKKCLEAVRTNNISQQWNIVHPIDRKRLFMCNAKENWWSSLSNQQEVLYQAIIDVLFTKVDLKVEEYLKSLQKSNGNLVKAVQDARRKLWIYWEWESWWFGYQYNEICSRDAFIYASDFLAENKKLSLTVNWFSPYMLEDYSQTGKCFRLYKLKLASYYKAAEVIINKANIERFSNSRREYVSDIRTKYNDFLFKLTTYIWQLGVIHSKWNTTTEQAQK